jgi:hypothetical protein
MGSMTTWEPPAGLERALKEAFGVRARLLPTPAMTGRLLWQQTRNPDDYPPMDAETMHLFQRTSGQARVEICTPPRAETVPGFYEYDARWFYVACCTGLPCGTMTRYDGRYDRYKRGRYLIRFTVPNNWGHLGIFGVKAADANDGWLYPRHGTYETWAGWTEINLASDRGWHMEVIDGYAWAGDMPAPLDVWRDKLLRLALNQPAYARTVRDIIIQTIGAFHATGKDELVTVGRDALDTVPDASRLSLRPNTDGTYTYKARVSLPPHRLRLAHPEWSADVYAKARTRLLYYPQKKLGRIVAAWGALTVEPAQVLALRNDAIYLSVDPQWPDDGREGAMTRRRGIAASCDAPHTWGDIKRLRMTADGTKG